MDFLITDDELAALCGLPHIQQLAYLRGIRPYMDVQTGLVGIKRGISYQSIAEQLYVDAHQGIKSVRYSRTQVRRALPGLERMGLISLQSQGLKLILKCELARMGYSVQNKVVTNSSQQVGIETNHQHLENKVFFDVEKQKVDIAKTAKADTPLKESNYILLTDIVSKRTESISASVSLALNCLCTMIIPKGVNKYYNFKSTIEYENEINIKEPNYKLLIDDLEYHIKHKYQVFDKYIKY